MSRALAVYRPLEIGPQLVRAAQYLRMSTEHQRYSPLNQRQAIEAYAKEHGFMVVRTYADEGKSGLRLKNRPALQKMLDDVISRRRDYDAILVLDVSRWGRFQDTDESAAYEFICRKAGVRILYCAEPFPVDGGPLTSIMKVIKRSMAAEFSRDLSVKTHRGHCRLTRKGYWGGGSPGYGLRRMLVQEDGKRKTRMHQGQRKSLSSDHVIVVPGPRKEIATIRRIFQLYAHHRLSTNEIAEELNDAGIKTIAGHAWQCSSVLCVLKNEKYIGTNVYNRRSAKLGTREVRNSRRDWIRVQGAFEPIVSTDLFESVQSRLAQCTAKLSNDELLSRLKDLLARKGRLNTYIINADPDTPNERTYRARFGSVAQAYAAIGYTPRASNLGEALILSYRLRRTMLDDLRRMLLEAGVITEIVSMQRRTLRIGEEFTLGFVAAPRVSPQGAHLRWAINLPPSWDVDITVVLRLNADKELLDLYLLPSLIREGRTIRLGVSGMEWIDTYRCSSLQTVLDLVLLAKTSARPFMQCHREWASCNRVAHKVSGDRSRSNAQGFC
jgi:DNA invertase Pin-like site-specific DNA recombinase